MLTTRAPPPPHPPSPNPSRARRLQIHRWALYIDASDDVLGRLSEAEQAFHRKLVVERASCLQETYLAQMPEGLDSLEADMARLQEGPNTAVHVYASIDEDLGFVPMGGLGGVGRGGVVVPQGGCGGGVAGIAWAKSRHTRPVGAMRRACLRSHGPCPPAPSAPWTLRGG